MYQKHSWVIKGLIAITISILATQLTISAFFLNSSPILKVHAQQTSAYTTSGFSPSSLRQVNTTAVVSPTEEIAPSATPTLTPTPTHIASPFPTLIVLPTITEQQTSPITSSQSSLASEMIKLINSKRQSMGLSELVLNAALSKAAYRIADDNAHRGALGDCGHTGSDGADFVRRAAEVGYAGVVTGETVGCGHVSAQSIVDAWWNSPGHYGILTSAEITTAGAAWVAGNHTAQAVVVGK